MRPARSIRFKPSPPLALASHPLSGRLCYFLSVDSGLGIAYMAYRIAALQALPHPDIGWESSSTGHRSLDFKITRASGNADWVVTSASIRGNWLRRRYLARGSVEHEHEFQGEIIRSYQPAGPWLQYIVFNSPVTPDAIVLHPETPDCEVKLKITLRTLPSPTVVRRIKLKRYRPRP